MDVFKNAFAETPEKIEIPTEESPAPEVTEEPETVVEAPKVEPSKEQDGLEAKPEEKEPENRDDKGRFVKTVPHEALHAERKRREALEAELAQLKAGKAEAPKSVFENEDEAFQQRLSEASRPIVQRLFNMSVAAAKRAPGREDYQEVYDFMNAEVQTHPELMALINQADDPGEYIYQVGKTRKELAEVGGDISKLRESIAQKERAKLTEATTRIKTLEAELAQLKGSKEKREAVPQSLNAEQSASAKDEVFKGPTALRDVLPKI